MYFCASSQKAGSVSKSLDSETHAKIKDLAEYEGRSINGEIIYLIRQAIKKKEKDNG